jgi:hypothetical protein
MLGTGPVQRPVLYAVAWSCGIIVVSALAATWRFKRI